MASRIERLEKGDKGVRVNDTRLGNSVLSPNTYTNQIEMKNLKSGEMTPLTSIREIVWSWSGDLNGGGTLSPTEVVPDTVVVNEIVISRPPPYAGNAEISVVFPGGFEIHTGIADGQPVNARAVHVQLKKNDMVYLRLDCADSGATDVTVALRLGQPTGLEDNSTVESYCVELEVPM
jgi:hypothetical protein